MKLFKVLSSTVLATAISVTTIQSAHATTQSTSSSSGQSDQTVLSITLMHKQLVPLTG